MGKGRVADAVNHDFGGEDGAGGTMRTPCPGAPCNKQNATLNMKALSDAELIQLATEWAEAFARCVRERDFFAAKQLFCAHVHSYGTRAVEANGLEQLVEQQWTPTWNRTRGFEHLPGSLDVQLSGDGSLAIVCARWASEGVDTPERWGQQAPYRRSGRCTYALTGDGSGGWRCVHTHFSLDPSAGPN